MSKQKKKSINFFFSIAILLVAFAFFARTWMEIPEDTKKRDALPEQQLLSSQPKPSRKEEQKPNPIDTTVEDSSLVGESDEDEELTAPAGALVESPALAPAPVIPPDLPDDLRQQLASPPPELPDDLKAQLNAPPAELPEDIKRALEIPPRIVTIDEVNTPP